MKNPESERKAQATFEYVVLVGAAIVVIAIFLNPSGVFRNTVERLLSGSVNQLDSIVQSVNTF